MARALEAPVALMRRHEAERAQAPAAEAREVARAAGATDTEMLALGLDGLARVTLGGIEEGMRRLDEAVAAAVAGEVADPDLLQTIYCYLIYACKRIRDFDRAAEWCARVQETARRWSDRHMFALCRVHYADVLVWRGAWSEAESELQEATAVLDETTGGRTADGRVRLADLRRRQGRLDEAERLLAEAEAHPLAPLVRGELERGDAVGAAEAAERYLRRVPVSQRTERTAALELLARARIASGEVERADRALAELADIATAIGTEPLRGAHAFVAGLRAAAAGEYDRERQLLEDAVDLLAAGQSPYEAARARAALARVLDALGRRRAAEREAAAAVAVLAQRGAVREARRAAALLSPPPADARGLTRREIDILKLVAAGKGNQQIAAELVLSVRTVERHMSSIYAKLGVSGATARATAVAYAAAHGYA